jgi:predicted O-methyltransferase YrrM
VAEQGTAAYDSIDDLPPLVRAAVDLARAARFPYSCLPEQGALLRLLAAGAGPGTIGETGTGYGVGLAWLASGAHPDARLFSAERDPGRVEAARAVFRERSTVDIHGGDWTQLRAYAPYDLLVLDGGGQGKGMEPPLDPSDWLRPGGLLVIDDFAPLTGWPPRHAGHVDTVRQHWLDHPQLRATQINVTPASATILATYLGGAWIRRPAHDSMSSSGP